MKENILKRTLSHLKFVYKDLLPLSFSLAFLLLIITALSMINGLAIISFILLLFLFFPLLLSVELSATKVFSKKSEIDYKQIYQQLKLYFTPSFKGVYGVIGALFFAIFSIFVFSFLFESIYLYINPDLMDIALNDSNLFIQKLINDPFFLNSVVVIFGLMIFVFLFKVFSKLTHPYLNYFCGIQKRYVKKYISYLKLEKKYPYKSNLFKLGLPLALIYLISYIVVALISYNLLSDYILAILIGISFSVILSSFYLPIYMCGCYIVSMELKNDALAFLKKEITREYDLFISSPSLSEDEKRFIQEKYDKVSKIFKNEKENNDENKKDEE